MGTRAWGTRVPTSCAVGAFVSVGGTPACWRPSDRRRAPRRGPTSTTHRDNPSAPSNRLGVAPNNPIETAFNFLWHGKPIRFGTSRVEMSLSPRPSSPPGSSRRRQRRRTQKYSSRNAPITARRTALGCAVDEHDRTDACLTGHVSVGVQPQKHGDGHTFRRRWRRLLASKIAD